MSVVYSSRETKQTKKTSRTVFVIYVEWNSCEIIISNEVEIGKHLGVTDARKMLSEGKPQKIYHPTNQEKRTHNSFNAQVNIYFMRNKITREKVSKIRFPQDRLF